MLASILILRARPLLSRRFWVLSARLLGSFLCCAILAGVALGQQTVRLEGTVRTDTGLTLKSGVNVRVENDKGELVAEQPANSEGAFHFESLPKMNCRLIVTAEGFEPHEEHLDLGYGSTFVIRYVSLRPLQKVSAGAEAAEVQTDRLAPKNAKREYEKAASDLARKNLDGAKEHLGNAVKAYPCYARAQTDLATLLEARNDLASAETALKKARECDPDYVDSYIVLGQMFNGQKRFEDSAQVLQEGLRRSPGSWQFYYQLGVAHFGLGQYSKAESEYQKVLMLNASPPPDFRVKLADVYLKEKAYDKAYAQMDEYLKAEPNGRFAAKVTGIMQQMKASGVIGQPDTTKH
jgi:tetratricopeptide (TPR) repeat protein